MTSTNDRELALRAVRAAGEVTLVAFGRALTVEAKTSGVDLVTEVDRAAEAAAVAVLRAERPQDGLLGEEGAAAARGPGGRRWVVDALDGTLNYVGGLPHWCCAVALEDDGGVAAGAVLDPLRNEAFSAARGEGAWLDGTRLPPLDRGRALSRASVGTYVDPARVGGPEILPTLERLVRAGASLRILGSGSLELAWVAAGRLDAWIQADSAPWDWLPGALLVTEAGGRAAVLPGTPAWHVTAAAGLHDELAAALLG